MIPFEAQTPAIMKTELLDKAAQAKLKWEELESKKQEEKEEKIKELGDLFEIMVATKGWDRIINFIIKKRNVDNIVSQVKDIEKVKAQLYYIEAYEMLLNHVYGVIKAKNELLKKS